MRGSAGVESAAIESEPRIEGLKVQVAVLPPEVTVFIETHPGIFLPFTLNVTLPGAVTLATIVVAVLKIKDDAPLSTKVVSCKVGPR